MNSLIENLNQWGATFLTFAWPMLWQSSLLIGLVFALDLMLARKIRAAVRYALWLAVLVKLLLPPTLALPTGAAWWLSQNQPEIKIPAAKNFTVSYDNAMPPMEFVPSNLPMPTPLPPKLERTGWLLLAVIAVSVALLLWLAVRWWQVAWMVRRAKPSLEFSEPLAEAMRLAGAPSTSSASCQINSQRAELVLGAPVRLKIIEGTMSPAVCGLFRPVILLPRALAEKLSAPQLRGVLLHEMFHLRRWDVWVNCAQALLQIFYWWHPLLWVANARIRRVREEAVDDAVMLALRDEAETYAPTLLEVAKLALRRPLMSLGLVGIMESRSALRQRIERLVDFRAPRKAGLTFASLCGIFVFSAVALPMGEAPVKVEKESPPVMLTPAIGSPNTKENLTNITHILTDPNYRTVLRALEQRGGFETLGEPEPVNTSGRQAQLRAVNVVENTASPDNTVAELVASAKLSYEMGRLDEAKTKFAQTLVMEPQNARAKYYLNLIDQAQAKAGVGGSQTNLFLLTNGRRDIVSKLDKIRLEKFSSTNLPLVEVVKQLSEQSRLRDPERKGINFLITPNLDQSGPVSSSVSGGAVGEKVDIATAATLTVNLTNVSLADVLDVISVVAEHPDGHDLKYSIKDYGVVFADKGAEIPLMFTRWFKVETNIFLDNLAMSAKVNRVKVKVNSPDKYAYMTPASSPQEVVQRVCRVFTNAGVNLEAPPGKAVFYNDTNGILMVRATEKDLDVVGKQIAKLNYSPPQIHIKARFVEVALGKSSGEYDLERYLNEFKLNETNAAAAMSTNAATITGILDDKNLRVVLRALQSRKGAETLGEPEVVTTTGRQAQMRVTEVVTVITNFLVEENPTNHDIAFSPQMISQLETGVTLDVVPYVLADGYTLNLALIPSWVEFLGYAKTNSHPFHTSTGKTIDVPGFHPLIRKHQLVTTVNLWDNQTVVLGGMESEKLVKEKIPVFSSLPLLGKLFEKQETVKTKTFVFVTATIVDPAGNRVHSDKDMERLHRLPVPPQPK